MKNKTRGRTQLIIASVAIAVVVCVGVGTCVLVTRDGDRGDGGTGSDIRSATSLSFDVTDTSTSSTFTLKVKDIGSSSMKMRIDGITAGIPCYIINGALQRVWMSYAGIWQELTAEDFLDLWSYWSTELSVYQESLASWTGSSSITVGTKTFFNIQVNPSLENSLFIT